MTNVVEVGQYWACGLPGIGTTYLGLIGHQSKPAATAFTIVEAGGEQRMKTKHYNTSWRDAVAECESVAMKIAGTISLETGREVPLVTQPVFVQLIRPPRFDWTLERIHAQAVDGMKQRALEGKVVPSEYVLFVPPAEGACMRMHVLETLEIHAEFMRTACEALGNLHKYRAWTFVSLVRVDLTGPKGQTITNRPAVLAASAEAAGRSWSSLVPAVVDGNERIMSFLPDEHWAVALHQLKEPPGRCRLNFQWEGADKLPGSVHA